MRVERILAPNPSIYTGPGTNTYLIESVDEALILDPGPVIASHLEAIVLAVADLNPVGVVATHTHPITPRWPTHWPRSSTFRSTAMNEAWTSFRTSGSAMATPSRSA